MTEHEWVRENLDAYVAGALSAADLGRVALHVADCADCKEALTCAQKLETTMAELFADARPDAKLEDRMIRRLRQARVPFRWSMWMRFAAGAAAVVLLGVVGAIVQAVAAGNAGPLGGLRMATRTDDERQARTYFGARTRGNVERDRNKEGKEGFSVVDIDPAATELDSDIKYMNERIAEASVPGANNPGIDGKLDENDGKNGKPITSINSIVVDDSRSMDGTIFARRG